jgi:hypothetical protein
MVNAPNNGGASAVRRDEMLQAPQRKGRRGESIPNQEGLPVLTNRAKMQAMDDSPGKIKDGEKRGLSQSPSLQQLQTFEGQG